MSAELPPRTSKVHHIGAIVADLDAAIAGFRQHLDLPLERVETYGEELDIAFLPCGETLVELIRPRGPDGDSAEYLSEHGPGIQHVALEVPDLAEALAGLRARGVRVLGEAPRPGAGNTIIAFLDPDAFGGILVELCQPLPDAA